MADNQVDVKLNATQDFSGRYLKDSETGKILQANNDADFEEAKQAGFTPISAHEINLRQSAKSTTDSFLAAGAGAARGLTFGLSDVVASAISPEAQEKLSVLKEAHGFASGVGEFGGIAGGLVAGGLAGAGVKAVSKLGASAGEAAASKIGTGIFSKVAGAATQGAVEGAVYGAGTAASDLALDERPLSASMVGGELLKGALFGAATGGVLGGALTGGMEAVKSGAKFAGKGIPDLSKEGIAGQIITTKAGVKNIKELSNKFNTFEQKELNKAIGKFSEDIPSLRSADGKPFSIFVKEDGDAVKTIGELYDNAEKARRMVGKKISELIADPAIINKVITDVDNILSTGGMAKDIIAKTDDLWIGNTSAKEFLTKHEIINKATPKSEIQSLEKRFEQLKEATNGIKEDITNQYAMKLDQSLDGDNIDRILNFMQAQDDGGIKALSNIVSKTTDNYTRLQSAFHMKEELYQRLGNKGYTTTAPSDQVMLERAFARELRAEVENRIVDVSNSIPSLKDFKQLNLDYPKIARIHDLTEGLLTKDTAGQFNTSLNPIHVLIAGTGLLNLTNPVGLAAAAYEGKNMLNKALASPESAMTIKNALKWLPQESNIKGVLGGISKSSFVNATGNSAQNLIVRNLADSFLKDSKAFDDMNKKIDEMDIAKNAETSAAYMSPANVAHAIKSATLAQQYLQQERPKKNIDPLSGQVYPPTRKEMLDYIEKVAVAMNPESALKTLQRGNSLSPITSNTLKSVYPGVYSAIQESMNYGNAQQDKSSTRDRISRTEAISDSSNKAVIDARILRQANFNQDSQQGNTRPSSAKSKSPSLELSSDRIQKR